MSNEIPTQPRPDNGNGGRLYDYRMQQQENQAKSMQDQIDDLEDIVNKQAIEIAKLQERLSIFSLAEGALTIIMGAVAAFIGRIGQ